MNLSTDQVSVGANELAPPSQPHRLSTSCDVHPEERFSGFCPSCLCERLSVLDHNGAPAQASSSSRKPASISTAALKGLFKASGGSNNNGNGNGRVRAGFFPELRRSKSFSGKNNEGLSGGIEPQRRSCDVRLREENRSISRKEAGKVEEEEEASVSEAVVEEEEEESCDSGEIKSNEIVEEVKREEEEEIMKPMKEYMDLYPHTKKPSSVAGTFFSAASVFSKKLQKWRHKTKKPRGGQEVGRRPQLPAARRQPRDTQSEIADYRRSSDTDPRFSLDAARFSVDDSRYSLDYEPRASSWDGHLIGRTTLPPTARVPPPPSMLSVAPMHRSDPCINGESDPIIITPGGSTQTRDYYYYTEPRSRKSLDRSNSIKKTMEMESVSNSRVSPAESYSIHNKVNHNVDKKSRRWGKWSMLGGFIYRKGVSSKEEEEEDRYSRSNSSGMVERSFSESWPELRNDGGGGGPKMKRSNSNVSWRSTSNKSWRNSSSKTKGGENGMLRFYLTPSWRNGGGGGSGSGGWEKTAAKANSHGHSIARRVMRLY